jgi:hypothetical protein
LDEGNRGPEWLALIQADPEMRFDGFAEAKTPDGVSRYENQGLAVWEALLQERYRWGYGVARLPSGLRYSQKPPTKRFLEK